MGNGLIGLVILLINAFMGGDTGELLNQLQQQAAPTEQRHSSRRKINSPSSLQWSFC